MNAKKEVYAKKDALDLLKDIQKLYVAKGKKVVEFDLMKEQPDAEALEKVVLGPTGNLRAPTLRKGKTMVVGFNQEMYEQVFGG